MNKELLVKAAGVFLLVTGILLLISSMARAQDFTSYEVSCHPAAAVYITLTEDYNEVIEREFVADGITYHLWVNRDTGTYSVVALPGNGEACYIEHGRAEILIQPRV